MAAWALLMVSVGLVCVSLASRLRPRKCGQGGDNLGDVIARGDNNYRFGLQDRSFSLAPAQRYMHM